MVEGHIVTEGNYKVMEAGGLIRGLDDYFSTHCDWMIGYVHRGVDLTLKIEAKTNFSSPLVPLPVIMLNRLREFARILEVGP